MLHNAGQLLLICSIISSCSPKEQQFPLSGEKYSLFNLLYLITSQE